MSQDDAPNTPAKLGYRMPAEWEPHEATWLTWPNSEDWPGKLQAIRWVFCEIARQLTKSEKVHLIVSGAANKRSAMHSLEQAHVNLDRVEFFTAATDRTWTRDNLPQFVINQSGTDVAAVKWRFNGWARYPDHKKDEAAGLSVAKAAGRYWLPSAANGSRKRRVVLEGGAIDVDGEGTLLTTRRCLLGSPFRRNPGLDRVAMERLLRSYLGVRKVIWLQDGIAGDDTSGHVDDFARFVGPGCVVLPAETERSDENHTILQQARRRLGRVRDARGRGLQLVELPMPKPLWFDGERLPASYANFYIANDRVLVPTFNDPNDRIALDILAHAFANREICPIHSVDLVLGLGTIHCSTQQQPARRVSPTKLG